MPNVILRYMNTRHEIKSWKKDTCFITNENIIPSYLNEYANFTGLLKEHKIKRITLLFIEDKEK